MRNNTKKLSKYSLVLPSLFDGDFLSGFFEGNLPAVNVKENKKNYKIELSVPGFEKEDINIEVVQDTITISANKESKHEEKDEDEKVIRQEFKSSSFSRSFTLANNVDTDNITAKEKNGVLTLTLPKKENAAEDSSKKISIK